MGIPMWMQDPYTGKMTSLYWDRPLVLKLEQMGQYNGYWNPDFLCRHAISNLDIDYAE